MDFIPLPPVSVDMRDATMPGKHVPVPAGAFKARFKGAASVNTKNGPTHKLFFEIDGFAGSERNMLLDLNLLNAVAQNPALAAGDNADRVRRTKSDLLALLVSGGFPAQNVQTVLQGLDLNKYLPQMTFHVWHMPGERTGDAATSTYDEIRFLAPDVWEERRRAAEAQAQQAPSNAVQTAGPGTSAPPPSIDKGALAAAMGGGLNAAPGGLPTATPGALPGGGLPGFGSPQGAPNAASGVPNGLPNFGALGQPGGVGSFLGQR